MSVESDPFAKVKFTIKSRPIARDVEFTVRVPTMRMEEEHMKLHAEALDNTKNHDEFWSRVKSMTEMGVIGWSETAPFSFDAIKGLLGFEDMVRLAFKWPEASLLTEDDRGNSGSPPAATPA